VFNLNENEKKETKWTQTLEFFFFFFDEKGHEDLLIIKKNYVTQNRDDWKMVIFL